MDIYQHDFQMIRTLWLMFEFRIFCMSMPYWIATIQMQILHKIFENSRAELFTHIVVQKSKKILISWNWVWIDLRWKLSLNKPKVIRKSIKILLIILFSGILENRYEIGIFAENEICWHFVRTRLNYWQVEGGLLEPFFETGKPMEKVPEN